MAFKWWHYGAGLALASVAAIGISPIGPRLVAWGGLGSGVSAALATVVYKGKMPSRIADATTLEAAVRLAPEGATLLLQPGRYGPVVLRNVRFGHPVTLASADPKRPAVLTGVELVNVDGLTFQDIEFDSDPAHGMYGFKITKSANITLQRMFIHGTLDGNPGNDKSPLIIRDSEHVKVADCRFQELFHGITFLNGRHFTFSGNSFRDMRTDGIRGGGASDVIVRRNVFTGFKPRPKDHPDGIQLWTTNTTAPARNILIEGNLVIRGDGVPTQGIFVRDTFNQFPFEQLTIRNNAVIGGLYNAISVGGVTGGTIERNLVAGLPGQKSWIRMGIANDVDLRDNVATTYLLSKTANVREANNRKIAMPGDGGRAVLAEWLGRGDNRRQLVGQLRAAGIP